MNPLSSQSYYFKFTIKGLIGFILLWTLLYIEPITIGILKVSQIWKAVIVSAVFLFLINKKKQPYVVLGLLFAFKYLFYSYFPYGIVQTLQEVLEAMIFPLSLGFLFIYYRAKKNPSEKLMNIIIFLSLFFIYSTIPFLIGLKSLNPETDLSQYGLKEAAVKGLFYHIASASKVFSFSTIVIINVYSRFSNSFLSKLFWLITVGLGCYLVYASWTRTAWVFFFIAVMITLFYGKTLRVRLLASIFALISIAGIFYLYQNNQALRYRVTGGAVYRQNTELTTDQIAQSRLPMIAVAIDNIEKEEFISKLIGYGKQHGIDLFDRKMKMAIVSHNRTFEILESSGLIGFILYFIFIFSLFKSTNRFRPSVSNEKRRLSYVLFILFLGYYLTSHGSTIWGEIIIALIIISIKMEYFEKLKNRYLENF